MVISTLDVRLRTPSLPTIEDVLWQSQTPSNALEFGLQSTLIRERIRRHADSSSTSVVDALEMLAEGAEMIAHAMVLITTRHAELQAANEAPSKRIPYKRKRAQQQGTLTGNEGVRLTTLKEFGVRSDGKKVSKRVRFEAGEPSQRRCGRCGESGHNARTCKQEVAVESE